MFEHENPVLRYFPSNTMMARGRVQKNTFIKTTPHSFLHSPIHPQKPASSKFLEYVPSGLQDQRICVVLVPNHSLQVIRLLGMFRSSRPTNHLLLLLLFHMQAFFAIINNIVTPMELVIREHTMSSGFRDMPTTELRCEVEEIDLGFIFYFILEKMLILSILLT